MKKLTALFLAIMMCMSLCASVFASDGSYTLQNHPEIIVTTETADISAKTAILPRTRVHLNEDLANLTFSDGFTCRSGQGTDLGIGVSNDGDDDIRVYITFDGEEVSPYPYIVSPGRVKYTYFDGDSQMTQDVEIYIESTSSARMSGKVVAVQSNNSRDIQDYV